MDCSKTREFSQNKLECLRLIIDIYIYIDNHSSLKILKSSFKNINFNTQELPVILSVVNGPSSEIKGSEEDDQQDHVLKRFSLIWCTNHRAAQDKREPVEDNAHGEELVAEVGQEWEEDIEVTES